MSPETIRKEMKLKKSKTKEPKKTKNFIWIRLMITTILTLAIFIGIKQSKTFKKEFYKQVYETNFSFAYINNVYKNLFGNPIPFQELVKTPVQATFKEKLTYKQKENYKEGVKLTVEDHYLVPIKNSGLVVFIGEKEGYGKTVIIQQMNGIDLWYGGLKEINVKLYDYVEEGSLLGETENQNLFLVFKKEGTVLDYKEYLS